MQDCVQCRSDSSVPPEGPQQNAIPLVLLILAATVCLGRDCMRPFDLPKPPTRAIGHRDCASTCGSWKWFPCPNTGATPGSTAPGSRTPGSPGDRSIYEDST